jgi:hypothetical protein
MSDFKISNGSVNFIDTLVNAGEKSVWSASSLYNVGIDRYIDQASTGDVLFFDGTEWTYGPGGGGGGRWLLWRW